MSRLHVHVNSHKTFEKSRSNSFWLIASKRKSLQKWHEELKDNISWISSKDINTWIEFQIQCYTDISNLVLQAGTMCYSKIVRHTERDGHYTRIAAILDCPIVRWFCFPIERTFFLVRHGVGSLHNFSLSSGMSCPECGSSYLHKNKVNETLQKRHSL